MGHLVPLEEAAQVTDPLPFQQLVPIQVIVAVVSRSRHQDFADHLERLLPFFIQGELVPMHQRSQVDAAAVILSRSEMTLQT